ncbi:hypothetical protein [Guptibacillus spartinae]|uniref:hypothetical protein n=1 Tax=Guptibacillus spartinae TaxID=3025679 RepID=UPI002361D415|nr:hypothetical protein [Pseudalkalibacillus spartinae]
MDNIIYYPGFQINDDEWLKFALLYLDNVSTIVPFEGTPYLTGTHRFLLEETNLLNKYSPTYDEICKSTDDAIWCLSKETKNPKKLLGILGEVDILDFLRQPQIQVYELFRGKFSYEFGEYCLDAGFAHESENGIRLPYQLGIMYMSILAHNIGDYNNMSVITDLADERIIRRVNDKTWSYNKRFEEIKAIKKLISLEIPTELDQIPIKRIVELRNKESFQRKLQEFKLAVSELSHLSKTNLTEQSVFEIRNDILSAKENISSDIFQLCTSMSSMFLGVHIVLNNEAGDLALLKELFGVGVLANAPMIYGKIQRNWHKQLATRYLTDIRNLDRRKAGLLRNAARIFE